MGPRYAHVSKETYKQTYSEAKETKVSVKRDLVWRKKEAYKL